MSADNPYEQTLPMDILQDYPADTACIRYLKRDNFKILDWYIGAKKDLDNEYTLREHLQRHFPNAEFIGWALK